MDSSDVAPRYAWPLVSVYPIATVTFWFLYSVGWTHISKGLLRGRAKQAHGRLSALSDRFWRANCNSCLHAVLVVLLLLVMFATDDGRLWTRRIEPYYNPFGYSAVCVSLGYFSFAIPWQYRILCCERREHKGAIQPALVVHHLIVVTAALVYVLSCYCAVYGAVAFACMEFTNWFFVPWTMLEMLGLDGTTVHQVAGVLLVVTYLVFRIGICTWQGVRFTIDLAAFAEAQPAEEVALVVLAFACYMFALLLSWAWLGKVFTGLRDGLRIILSQRRASRAVRPEQGHEDASASDGAAYIASNFQSVEEVRAKPSSNPVSPDS